MSNIAELKERVLVAEAEVERMTGLLSAFFTGVVPERGAGGIDGIVLAQWGRKRLAEKQKNKTAVLLTPTK